MTTTKNGFSTKSFERTMDIRYQTAWTILQRFRIAMVRNNRECLSGTVEVDETLVGGIKHGGKRGRGTNKSVVVIAVEILKPKGFGRLHFSNDSYIVNRVVEEPKCNRHRKYWGLQITLPSPYISYPLADCNNTMFNVMPDPEFF